MIRMTFFKTALYISAIVAVFTLAGISLSCAQIDNADSMVVADARAVPVISSADISPEDAGGKGAKKRRKSSAKKHEEMSVETIPGEKLTIKQVLNILKTTRDLSGKNLSGLKLVGINLGKCNLKGIDLKHADLERADLGESDLERADLTDANLKMSNLRQSGMKGAHLERAILDGAIWKDGMVCVPGSVGQCRELAFVPAADK